MDSIQILPELGREQPEGLDRISTPPNLLHRRIGRNHRVQVHHTPSVGRTWRDSFHRIPLLWKKSQDAFQKVGEHLDMGKSPLCSRHGRCLAVLQRDFWTMFSLFVCLSPWFVAPRRLGDRQGCPPINRFHPRTNNSVLFNNTHLSGCGV